MFAQVNGFGLHGFGKGLFTRIEMMVFGLKIIAYFDKASTLDARIFGNLPMENGKAAFIMSSRPAPKGPEFTSKELVDVDILPNGAIVVFDVYADGETTREKVGRYQQNQQNSGMNVESTWRTPGVLVVKSWKQGTKVPRTTRELEGKTP